MKLFSTFIQRIVVLTFVLFIVCVTNAAERTFATLAEMHAATDLAVGDQIKITGDVVFEYSYTTNFVVSDKNGTASCMNDYCYYIGQVIAKQSLKAGDILKNYSGELKISSTGVYRLEPMLNNKDDNFAGGITIEHTNSAYEVKTTKVTIKDLLENPANYDGKVVSLDLATTKTVGFDTYLIQGTDTLKGFTISGLNDDAYPSELKIKRALFKVNSYGAGSLSMSQQDFDVTFMSIKSFKATDLTENMEIDLTVQVLKKEVYEGKTYLTVFEGEGDKLIDYAGLRILLNIENDEDKNIKAGDVINIKSSAAKYKKSEKQSIYFTHSLVTLDEHEIQILSNEAISYCLIYPDNINMLTEFEFLPVSVYGLMSLTGKENALHKEHHFAEAVFDDDVKIFIDITKKPDNIADEFIVNGCLEIPLWQEKSSRSYIIPLSEKDFATDMMSFSNIQEIIDYGVHKNPIVKYKITGDLTITGIQKIQAVGEEDQARNLSFVFVCDETSHIMLAGDLGGGYKVGNVITNVEGSYSEIRKTQITTAGERDFGVARFLSLDSTSTSVIEMGSLATTVTPKEVTIAELLSDEELASSVVRISDFTYDTVVEVVQDIVVENYYIHQGTDSIAVDSSFVTIKNDSIIDVIYCLNGFYTRLFPYTPEKIVATNNVFVDNSLFVYNDVVYANNAYIEVYDLMGRLLASGLNAVFVDDIESVLIVRTKYSDGQTFVTKVVKY